MHLLQIQPRGGKSPIKINKHLSCEDLAPCRGMGLGRGFDSWIFWCRTSGNTAYWGNVVVSLCGASGNTLYWVLLLVYMGPRATHFTGYCCWFMWGLGQHTLLGIVVGLSGASATQFTEHCCWFTWGLGQRTLLYIVGLYEVLDNTLYWASLFCHGSSAMGLKYYF
jgi:hypothetical protein